MMTMDRTEQWIDDAGKHVLTFASEVLNYKAKDLIAKIRAMVDSGDWRQYKTATGTHNWREAEFDYFLIACECPWVEVRDIIGYARVAEWLAPLMDHEAEPARRRSLEEASATHPPVLFETLIQQAQRLGWTQMRPEAIGSRKVLASTLLKSPPVPRRALLRMRGGETNEQRASRLRREKIAPARRTELDALIADLREKYGHDERRYIIDALK